jgi:CRP-like cAMP-binding protein
MPNTPILQSMLRKLESRHPLEEGDRQALLALPVTVRMLDPSAYLIREGESSPHCFLLAGGFAFRQKSTAGGARQILRFHVPGDLLGLHSIMLGVADHSIQALSRCEVAAIGRSAMLELIAAHRGIARAICADILVDGSIFREWILNVGRRAARTRVAHLLCEFARQLDLAGLAENGSYRLPMTQEQIADACGLTPVHVNRVLQQLERDDLIVRDRRKLTIPDWERLCEAGDFNPSYLHIDRAGREPALAA